MSTATVEQIGQNFAVWLAAVRRGETVAIVDEGREIARLTPPIEKPQSKAPNPWTNRMAELEAIFPEPVLGASEGAGRNACRPSLMFAYADSSLLMKLYVREPNSPDAIAAVQKVGKPLLFTPLHKLEISGSIRCNVKRGTLTASKAAQALPLLQHDLKNAVYVISLGGLAAGLQSGSSLEPTP